MSPPPSKRAKTESEASSPRRSPLVDSKILNLRRKKLETRYLGQTFLDSDDPKPRTISRIEYETEDAVWVAVGKDAEGAEQPYYLNVASGMDSMIDAYRRRDRPVVPAPREPAVGRAVEVLWDVFDEETEETQRVWWRAEILEKLDTQHSLQDGDDRVDLDVWRVRYDARPELSEPEPADHNVCFLSARALFDVTNDHVVMQWRVDGADDDVADITDDLMGRDDDDDDDDLLEEGGEPNTTDAIKTKVEHLVDAAVQSVLDGALKHRFDALPRDRQCAVADVFLAAKNRLKERLATHVAAKPSIHRTVTPDDIQLVLADLKDELANLPALIGGADPTNNNSITGGGGGGAAS